MTVRGGTVSCDSKGRDSVDHVTVRGGTVSCDSKGRDSVM